MMTESTRMSAECSPKWRGFSQHLQSMLRDLYEGGRHSDITLICEAQVQFRAHRIVLSACSPVFREIIDSNPSQHPLIYLRGIQGQDMKAVLQFMYLGEATLHQERMVEFLKVAKDLEVKELCIRNKSNNENTETLGATPDQSEDQPTINIKSASDQLLEVETSEVIEVTEERDDQFDHEDEEISNNEEDDRNQMIERTTTNADKFHKKEGEEPPVIKYKDINDLSIDPGYPVCPECGALFTKKSSVFTHYEAVHLGITYQCDKCDHKAKSRGNLDRHIQARHGDPRYFCDQCDYQSTEKICLKRHIESRHQNIRYPCVQCNHKARCVSSLKAHIRSKHEGIKYSCKECGQTFVSRGGLHFHLKSIHGNVKLWCDQCGQEFTHVYYLKEHMKRKHAN